MSSKMEGKKMKLTKKLFCIILFIAMLISLVACNTPQTTTTTQSETTQSTTASESETEPEIDISEEVNIKYVHIGGATPFEDEVLADLNKKLKEKINATFSVQYLGWGDAWTKAPLMFASGEDFDFIFCAPWFLFNDEGKKGAYLPLNDLLPKYAPELYNDCPEEAWAQSSINGEILMIPAYLQNNTVFWGEVYREDLRKKYNVPEIKKVTDFEAYFEAIKANEPEMMPYAVNYNETGILPIMYAMENTNLQIEGLDSKTMPFAYDITDPTCQLVPVAFDQTYAEWVVIAKKWADAGYWSKNALANQTSSADALVAGASAIAGWNSYTLADTYKRIKQKDENADLGFYMCIPKDGKIARRPFNANGMAINANSKNPERTLMLINLFVTDEDIYQTATYGIEGVTYTKASEGYFKQIDGLAPEEQWGFGHMFGMGFRNYRFEVEDTSVLPKDYVEKYSNPEWQEQFLVAPVITGLTFNTEPVKTEIAAVTEVNNNYVKVLDLGLVADPVATLAEYRAALLQAGIEKMQAEFQRQIDEFLASK
jgi:putative aldouronate transport system substrate-binding protein